MIEGLSWEDYKQVLDLNDDGWMIADGEGNVLYHNDAYLRTVNQRDMLGHNMREYIDRGDIKRSSALMAIEQKKEVTLFTIIKNRPGIFVSSTPLFDENGGVSRVITKAWNPSGTSSAKSQISISESGTNVPDVEIPTDYGQGIVVVSQKMKEVFNLATKIKDVGSTVLLLGESGVGKDVVAQYIHRNSILKDKPFIAVNCNVLPEPLLESELFGYVGGSFTGANKEGKRGLFEAAHDGILFMDEIGDISLSFQAKLLRVLETKSIVKVGDYKTIPVNVRIIAATNKNIEEMVSARTFREDLYYRLNVVTIHIPSLRHRQDDILPLSLYYLHHYNSLYNLKKRFSKNIIPVLRQYGWPGNIRELKNCIERLVVTSEHDLIQTSDLQPTKLLTECEEHFHERESAKADGGDISVSINGLITMDEAVACVERTLLTLAKTELGTNRRIAQKLNVSHATVCRKLRKYNIR